MKYTKYNPTTGEIISVLTITDANSLQTNLPDNNYIYQHYSSDEYYIDLTTKEPVSKSVKPNVNATWDYENKTWQSDTDKDVADARYQRNLLLTTIDRVNFIWYSSLTQEQQTELATYRQALLDVPAQSGFPNTVNWPSKPSWL